MNRQSTKDSEGSEDSLYDTAMMDTCHYTFVKTHRMYNTKSEPEDKLWTFSDFNVSICVHPWKQIYHSGK